MKSQASFISKFLQLEFPKAISIAITAPTVGGNQQMFATGIMGLSQLLPPATNRFNCKLCGIVVNPNVHPPLVLGEVIDAIGGNVLDRLHEYN